MIDDSPISFDEHSEYYNISGFLVELTGITYITQCLNNHFHRRNLAVEWLWDWNCQNGAFFPVVFTIWCENYSCRMGTWEAEMWSIWLKIFLNSMLFSWSVWILNIYYTDTRPTGMLQIPESVSEWGLPYLFSSHAMRQKEHHIVTRQCFWVTIEAIRFRQFVPFT